MQPIFLIGLPACGKTTLGLALARELGCRFVDLDHHIEQRLSMSIAEIFESRGENYFRELEHRELVELIAPTPATEEGRGARGAKSSGIIIACGGGTPCYKGNMELMNAHGLTIWLQASLTRQIERLWQGRAHRPHFAHLSKPEIEEKFLVLARSREQYYSLAKATFESSLLENAEEIAQSVAKFKEQFAPALTD